MQWNLAKTWLAISGLLVSSTSFANQTHQNDQTLLSSTRSLENRVAALEQKKAPGGVINPPVRPVVEDFDFNFFGDLLIWEANENDMQVAVKNTVPDFTALGALNLQNSEVKHIEFDYKPGFRLGVDFDSPYDGWDLGMTWLRIDISGIKDSDADTNEILWGSRINPALPTGIDLPTAPLAFAGVDSRLRGCLNQLDLDLGREFYVSKWLTLRPHAGIRTTWIRQRLKTHYHDGVAIGVLPVSPNVEVREKNNWWGIGIESGIDTVWGLGWGFSLYGNLAASIESGFQKVRTKQEVEDPEFIFEKNKDSFRVSRPILDLQLGMRWDRYFADNSVNFGLHFGWEQHTYFSQNQFHLEQGLGHFVVNQGDLSFQGWTLGAHIAL